MKQFRKVVCAILLIVFSIGMFNVSYSYAESGSEHFLDPNFDEGIYFSVQHPDSLQTMYAGGKGIGPLNIHQWKKLTINAVFRYKDENEHIQTVSLGNSNWNSSAPDVASINVKNHSTCEVATISPGTTVISVKYEHKGKTYLGSVTLNVRKLSVSDTSTMRYAALSILSYTDLQAYTGRTVREIATPKIAGGTFEATIVDADKQILASDNYKVFADIRDLIVACAGNCKIVATRDAGSFYGVLFSYGNQYIMAFRGTEASQLDDLRSDFRLGLGLVESNQFISALNFYKEYSQYSPILTGHSLGGGLANYVSVLTGARAYTFNAPSTLVTAVSNFLNGYDYDRLGRFFRGLNDNLRTDYVNSYDWVGRVGVGDSRSNIYTGDSLFSGDNKELQSGNLDRTIYYSPAKRSNSVYPSPIAPNHHVIRMISYDEYSETVKMMGTNGATSPSFHNFSFQGSDYYFGSTWTDSITYPIHTTSNRAVVLSGEGNDTINLPGYAEEIIVAGDGDDTIYGSTGDSTYYYYSGQGKDTVYDSAGNDFLYIWGISNINIEKDNNEDNCYITVLGSSEHLIDLHLGPGTGSLSIYLNNQLFDTIQRIGVCRTISADCPIQIEIYNDQDQFIERIEDGRAYEGSGEYGYFETHETQDGYGKTLTVTSDQYHVTLIGTAEGMMKYSCLYQQNGEKRVKSISSVPVHAGAKYYPASATNNYLLLADLNGDGTIDYQPSSQEISSVSIDESLTIYLGTTAQLTPTFSPSNKQADLVWENSNPDVVSISDDGILTALGVGEATITVSALNGENASASCTVTVPDESLSIADTTVTGIEKKVAYTGEAYYPEISVTFRGMTLSEGKAYYVEYSDEVMPGTTAVVIHGLGPFQGTKTIEYEIYQYVPQTVSEAVNAIVQEMNAAGITGEYNRAVWLHNWLIDHANYDYTYSYYSADGVLLNQTGVCQSYTLAYQLLLNKIGVENQVISSSEMDHAWNLVKLDGEWCHVDCTWDDPNEGGMENQFYFGMNDDLIGRDHTWNRSSYVKSTSLQNYYPIRNGELVFSNTSELDTVLTPHFTTQKDSITILYIGTDPEVTALSAFEEWYSNNNWKYGIRSFSSSYSKYRCSINEIEYTEPWAEPVNKLANPVDAPAFSMNSPNGNFSLDSYRGNGLVLIFGREGCLNTRGLLQRLQAELDALHNNGIEVLISVEAAETYSDIQPVKKDYPSFQYCYEQQGLLSAYLEAVDYYNTYDTGWITYPCVFIINGAGKITYYSTGPVSNLDELVSEAFTTSNTNPLPIPADNQYPSADTGNANLSSVGNGNVKRALESVCANSSGVFFLTDSSNYYYDSLMMEKWEEDYPLFESMGLSFVACFEELKDEDRLNYPHVTFVVYDENDPFFWDLLGAVGWDFSKPAYSQSSYFIEHDGHIADYCNGGTLSIWDKVAVLVRDLTYDMTTPAQLQAVDDEAFYGGRFTSVDLGQSSITSIGSMAFASCPNLRFIRLPDCLISIDPNAFLYSDSVVFVCGGNSVAAQFAEANNIPLICP